MIIKTFTADSTATALKRVRTEMGGDAVVLKTRQKNGEVEITACLDKPTGSQATSSLPDRNIPAAAPKSSVSGAADEQIGRVEANAVEDASISRRLEQIEKKLDKFLASHAPVEAEELAEVRSSLVGSGLSESIVNELLADIETSDENGIKNELRRRLEKRLAEVVADPIKFARGEKVLFFGPAGAGKTSLLGRTAARLVVEEKRKIKLLSLDNVKIGGVEEIQSYGDLLSAEVIDPDVGSDSGRSHKEIVLIDSPAINLDNDRLSALSEQVKQADPEHRVLVCSALHHLDDSLAFISRTKAFRPTCLAVTMLDLTSRWGVILSLCEATGLKIAFITDSAGGDGMARTPDAATCAVKIVNAESKHVPA